MFKRIILSLATGLALLSGAAFAATDVNRATVAELESLKGIGPGLSSRLADERKAAEFKDWSDLVTRVKGIGPGNARKFSDAGLTVNGQAYQGEALAAAKAPKAAKGGDKAAEKAPAKSKKAADAAAN